MSDIVIWDSKGSVILSKGSVMFLAEHAHVHTPEGLCIKNRDGEPCV